MKLCTNIYATKSSFSRAKIKLPNVIQSQYDLVQDKVELCIGLLHLVALVQAEECSTQQMLRIVHDNLEQEKNDEVNSK